MRESSRSFTLEDDAVTREAAARLVAVFHALTDRGVDREDALQLVLRRALALFGGPADAGPDALTADERAELAAIDGARVDPTVFGAIFQAGMDPRRRHATGAHYTREADILRIVDPTIVRPWTLQIAQSTTPEQLHDLHTRLSTFTVLDPACGSGNFLISTYRALARLEIALVRRLRDAGEPIPPPRVHLGQLHGIDRDPLAVALARLTLRAARRRVHREFCAAFAALPPADDRDADLLVDDALFCPWPACDAIVGNPPFMPKNKRQRELGAAYVRRLRARWPDIPGLADLCVYWFRRAHDELRPGGRAGLVGTNTIRENDSRAGGLDHLVRTGTITDAVATMVWSGDAAVHVSIVNWIKAPDVPGPKTLSWQDGDARDSPWTSVTVERINAALSPRTDVTLAVALAANADPQTCFQGQTHGHEGFLVPADEAAALLADDPDLASVLFPLLIGDDLLGRKDGSPSRHVIDFGDLDLLAARRHKKLFARVEASVLPSRERAAAEESARNAEALAEDPKAKVNHHHANFLAHWWRLSWRRGDMLAAIARLRRYIVCVRVTKRPVFEFVSAAIHPGDALVVFAFEDDYSFGILQSTPHWQWFNHRCSTLTRRFRYTSNTVHDSFPWPQSPTADQVRTVAVAAVALRTLRAALMKQHGLSRRNLYRTLEAPGASPLKDAQEALDAAVRAAHGMRPADDPLQFLLDLNLQLAATEEAGEPVVGPGLPPAAHALKKALVTRDCVTA